MSATTAFRVTYHFEVSGKRASEVMQDNIIASGQDYSSISTVLSNNNKTNNGHGTLVIVDVHAISGPSNFLS